MAKKKSPSKTTDLGNEKKKPEVDGFREGFESIVVAIILAFLFRAFEAEAFVIPTGSMASTLRGRHKDIDCPLCGQNYQAGDSQGQGMGNLEATVCPSCFYPNQLETRTTGDGTLNRKHVSHTGDRILVNKFAYERPFGDPKRWDVIVFKNPNNAKQNYIKRLVGLPNETIRLYHGDVYAKKGDSEFQILRKPPRKLWYMLQDVSDTQHISEYVETGAYPSNWNARTQGSWVAYDRKAFACEATATTNWLDYQHLSPSFDAWGKMIRGETVPPEDRQPSLVTDFYSYNERRTTQAGNHNRNDAEPRVTPHWVGDLCIDVDVSLTGDNGTFELQLIEAGRVHSCKFDVATGTATFSIDDGSVPFDAVDGKEATRELTAKTNVKGSGNHSIRFANTDNRLTLWVDNRHVSFDRPADYTVDPTTEFPVGTLIDPNNPSDPGDRGDLNPIRIGVTGVAANLQRLRVLRDIYYIAPVSTQPLLEVNDVEAPRHLRMRSLFSPSEHRDVFSKRQGKTFDSLSDDQFFPMGDNSPMSQDARLWAGNNWVERDMLIGKAVFIYWPHPYHIKIPFTNRTFPVFPDFTRMKLIR